MQTNKLPINKIRDIIERLNWSRRDATGGTREENKRYDLPAHLNLLIAEVQSLEIPPRFTRDIENKNNAIEYAKAAISRWMENNGIIQLSNH